MLPLCDDHVSLYQLTLERGTFLFKQVNQGFLPMPDLDVVSEMYECARLVLQDAGFHQYEVSNFARNVSLIFLKYSLHCDVPVEGNSLLVN